MNESHFLIAERIVNSWDLHACLKCLPALYQQQSAHFINKKWYFHYKHKYDTLAIVYNHSKSNASIFYDQWMRYTGDNYLRLKHDGISATREDIAVLLHYTNVIGKEIDGNECDIITCEDDVMMFVNMATQEMKPCSNETYFTAHLAKNATCIVNTKDICIFNAEISVYGQGQLVCLLFTNRPQKQELFYSDQPLLDTAARCLRKHCNSHDSLLIISSPQLLQTRAITKQLAIVVSNLLCNLKTNKDQDTVYIEVSEKTFDRLQSQTYHRSQSHSISHVAKFEKSDYNRSIENHFCTHLNSFANSVGSCNDLIHVKSFGSLSSSSTRYIRTSLLADVLLHISFLLKDNSEQ